MWRWGARRQDRRQDRALPDRSSRGARRSLPTGSSPWGKNVEHLPDGGDPRHGILREGPGVGDGAQEPSIDVDRAPTHPRDDPGALEIGSLRAREDERRGGPLPLEHPEDRHRERVDPGSLEHAQAHPDHSRANRVDRERAQRRPRSRVGRADRQDQDGNEKGVGGGEPGGEGHGSRWSIGVARRPVNERRRSGPACEAEPAHSARRAGSSTRP